MAHPGGERQHQGPAALQRAFPGDSLVRLLDYAGIRRGVVLSLAYLPLTDDEIRTIAGNTAPYLR